VHDWGPHSPRCARPSTRRWALRGPSARTLRVRQHPARAVSGVLERRTGGALSSPENPHGKPGIRFTMGRGDGGSRTRDGGFAACRAMPPDPARKAAFRPAAAGVRDSPCDSPRPPESQRPQSGSARGMPPVASPCGDRGGKRRARRPTPATVSPPRAGTARRAARGGSTSSNSGTGSPTWSPTRPSGQSPRFATTRTPSPARAAIAGRRNRPRRPRSAHHHTYPIEVRNPAAITAWNARHARMADDGRRAPVTPASRRRGASIEKHRRYRGGICACPPTVETV
jgi:hypothetical protein